MNAALPLVAFVAKRDREPMACALAASGSEPRVMHYRRSGCIADAAWKGCNAAHVVLFGSIRCALHAISLAWRCASSMRRHAMSKYLRSSSMPMNLRPRFMQATPVVPLPMKGSRTVSQGAGT